MHILKCFVLIFTVQQWECSNILLVIPFSSKSQYIMQRPIGIELAKRGHNVTVITAFIEPNAPPNYHQVKGQTRKIWELSDSGTINVFSTVNLSLEDFYDVLWPTLVTFTEAWLKSAEVSRLLSNNQTFDLVISEYFFQEASYMFAHKYNAPLVLISTFGNSMKHNILTRNPLQLSTVIFETLKLENPRSFLGRLRNAYITLYEYYWWRNWYLVKQEQLAVKYIPNLSEPIPSLLNLEKNTSLLLLNSHFSFEGPVAYLPHIVEIGGLHVSMDTDTLTQELQTILDNSKDGVIYVSFGTNVLVSDLSPEKKDVFLRVFGRFSKYTVLWKCDEDIKNKSSNVILKKWMSQNRILAHPNVKVFISHGGLLGTQEATYHAVPIIGIPVYGDQYNNLLQVQDLGYGKILEYNDINDETLYNNLYEVLNDASFKLKATEVSVRFKDRPMKPIDEAIYWIEYVIRNKGAHYMRNPAIGMSWIAYLMLDVYATVLLVFCILVIILFLIVKTLLVLYQSLTIKTKRD